MFEHFINVFNKIISFLKENINSTNGNCNDDDSFIDLFNDY